MLLLATGCGHAASKESQDAGLQTVTVSKPTVEQVTAFEQFTGRIVAIPSVEVRARVTGYLDKVLFKDGQEVKEGDKLYEVDRRPYQAEVDRLKAMVEKNTAGVVATNAELARQQQLLQQRATSRADYDKAVGFVGESTGGLKAAEAALEKAKLDLDFTIVMSPIAGQMSNTYVDAGNLVIADKTLLTTVVAVDPIYVDFSVDERTVLDFQANVRSKKVKSTADADLSVWISLATDGMEFPYQAKIDFIDNRLNTSTGTLKVRARLANPISDGQRRFTPGLFVRVKVPITEPRSQLLVADRAIGSDLDQKFLFVVNDQNKVERRPVKLGPLHNGLRVVEPVPVVATKQGMRPAQESEKGSPSLSADDRVVINGVQFVAPGAAVKTVEGKMTAAGE